MNWTPKTEEEVTAEELCPVGRQGFTVMAASEEVSKKGNFMYKLKLNVHGSDGFDYHIYDYLSPNFSPVKFRHFFFAIGEGATYDAGTVHTEDLVGCEGFCEVGIEPARGGYKAKAKINDYLLPDAKIERPKADGPEDDVPF